MARYIDADKLIAHLKDEIKACEPKFDGRANGKSVAYGTELGLKAAISFAETLSVADVAPKSEVAREIFEEIEKIRLKEIHKCETLRALEGEVSQRKYWEGGYNSLRQLSYWIAELKKKYTEEPSPARDNTCICCGEIIPEGRQVCPSCENDLKNYKVKGAKTKTIGKFVTPDMGVQLTIDDIGE